MFMKLSQRDAFGYPEKFKSAKGMKTLGRLVSGGNHSEDANYYYNSPEFI